MKGRTRVMGIVNATPDSFSDGGRYLNEDAAIEHALRMIYEGADIIDVGGESTRPGAVEVSAEEELRRVLPVIEELSKKTDKRISIDTCKPNVAERCLEAGASIVNDITGLADKKMLDAAAKHSATVVIMHMQGTPRNMQDNPFYKDVVDEIKGFFSQRTDAAENAGIRDIVLDPGLGFGKTVEHNLEILARLKEFRELGYPIMIGASRKSFIGKITGAKVDERLSGSIAAACIAAWNGADIVRVHDVRETVEALKIVDSARPWRK